MCFFSILVGVVSFLLWVFGAVSGEGAFIGYFIVAGLVQTAFALVFIMTTSGPPRDMVDLHAAQGAQHYIIVGPIQLIVALFLIFT